MNSFLNLVLPSKGLYCIFSTKAKKYIRQTFHDTIEELASVGDTQDSESRDAYFALATFKTVEGGRHQKNAQLLRSFFIELDCGEGKPYTDHADAAKALRVFVDQHKLPIPCIVNSGGGLHVYWPMQEDMALAEWQPVANGLKQLCIQRGLKIDAVISADSARVLRFPGTHNYKIAPRPVQILRMGAATTLEAFRVLMPMTPTPKVSLVDFSSVITAGSDALTKDLAGGDFPVCRFSKIVRSSVKGTGCPQIANIVMSASTLEEPLWRAGLSIAVRCEDGPEAIQKMSIGHPGYSEEATTAKAAATQGPYTCEWFRSNYPDRCSGCEHKVGSPIMLGKVVQEGGYIVDVNVISVVEGAVAPTVQVVIPKYPFPYFRGASGGVYLKTKDKSGDPVEVEVYRDDLYLTTRFFDMDENGDGDGEVVGVTVHLTHDGIRRFHAPVTSLFSTDKLRDQLVKHGVIAYGGQLALIMNYFNATMRQLQSTYAANRTRHQMGWTPDTLGFVIGEIEYTASGTKLAPPASGIRQLAGAFQQTGELQNWKAIADFYNTPSMEPLALALFFGFGSPLLKLLGGTAVRGAFVNLMSNKSGTGKTTVQEVINSIFGHPVALLADRKDSVAAKYHRLGMLNSICNTEDEITNIGDAELSDYAYGITSGRGRHRMEAQSNKLRVNNATWCNITVTSSNSSIVDKLSQMKNTADGELRRVLEMHVPVLDALVKGTADALFGKLSSNYGIAGPIFIKYVIAHRSEVLQMLKDTQATVDADLNLTTSDRFHSCILACAFVGAAISQRCGLHSIEIPRVYKYAMSLLADTRQVTRSATGDAKTVAIEATVAYVHDNMNGILVINSIGKGGLPSAPLREVRGNQLKLRYEPDRHELWVICADFKRYLHERQVDVQRSLTALTTAGILKFGGDEKSKRIGSGAVVGMPSLPTRCFCFDGNAIGLADELSAIAPDAPGE